MNVKSINRQFFGDVKKNLTVQQWEEVFPTLFYTSRTDNYQYRFAHLVSDSLRTTVLDLTLEEIVRLHEFLGWDYATLLEDYKLGYNKLTSREKDELVKEEGYVSGLVTHVA